jgi:hypothetical protein
MDMLMYPEAAKALLNIIHEFYLREVEFWATTDVDAIFFQDDWGSQQALLIQPDLWREWFKPLYRDYTDIAHAHGKFAFMHSDGNITSIYEDLVETGVDALNPPPIPKQDAGLFGNSQKICMIRREDLLPSLHLIWVLSRKLRRPYLSNGIWSIRMQAPEKFWISQSRSEICVLTRKQDDEKLCDLYRNILNYTGRRLQYDGPWKAQCHPYHGR